MNRALDLGRVYLLPMTGQRRRTLEGVHKRGHVHVQRLLRPIVSVIPQMSVQSRLWT